MEERQQATKSVLSEICYRVTHQVCTKYHITGPVIAEMAEAFIGKIEEMIGFPDQNMAWEFTATDTLVWLMIYEICNELEKEIPVVARIDVVANRVSRLEAKEDMTNAN